MLIQIRTTNAVESWHKKLKYSFGKGDLCKTSLTGCSKHVMVTADNYDIRARAAELDFYSKRHPLVLKHPWIESLPYPVQLLIIQELKIAEQQVEECNDSDGRELLDEVCCTCLFYHQYQLPCCHIQSNDKVFGCLCNEDFERYKCMWEDYSFETYYGNNKKYIARDIDDDSFAPQYI